MRFNAETIGAWFAGWFMSTGVSICVAALVDAPASPGWILAIFGGWPIVTAPIITYHAVSYWLSPVTRLRRQILQAERVLEVARLQKDLERRLSYIEENYR